MVPDDQANIWLAEPRSSDDSYAHRGEHVLAWLTRSTLPLAQECRRFLNENLAALPTAAQESLEEALWERWDSAFFELLVARVLQALGASLTVERSNPDNKHPDFTACFADQTVIVEAVSPVYNMALSDEEKQRSPLLNFIEAHLPQGWLVLVLELPHIGPTDSKKTFYSTVIRVLDIPSPGPEDSDFELVVEFPSGELRLHLFPDPSNPSRLGSEPPTVWWSNAESRIRKAVRRKRRQVRNSTEPVLLAIRASSLIGEALDFDKALFGHIYSKINLQGEVVVGGFSPDGEFNKRADKAASPTYAGVLAFLEGNWFGVPFPILYRHPRSDDKLPSILMQLEQRSYDPVSRKIQRQEATIDESALAGLKFVPRID